MFAGAPRRRHGCRRPTAPHGEPSQRQPRADPRPPHVYCQPDVYCQPGARASRALQPGGPRRRAELGPLRSAGLGRGLERVRPGARRDEGRARDAGRASGLPAAGSPPGIGERGALHLLRSDGAGARVCMLPKVGPGSVRARFRTRRFRLTTRTRHLGGFHGCRCACIRVYACTRICAASECAV